MQKKSSDLSDLALVKWRISEINKRFKPHDGQRKILNAVFRDNYKRVMQECGRSYGKSSICEYIAVRRACFPNQSIYIIGPDRKQQRRIMWDDWDTNIQRLIPKEFGASIIDTRSTITLPWGSFISIDGSENYANYRGVPYNMMVIDEGREIDWRFYDASYPNLSKKDGTLIVISSTPDDEYNSFLVKKNEIIHDPDWYYIHAPSWDNPYITDWLKKEQQKYFRRGDHAEWSIEYEAIFVRGGKRSIFPMFSHLNHIRPHDWMVDYIKPDARHLEYWTIFDPGYNSVFGVLFCALNRHTSQVFLLDEIYESDRTANSSKQIWCRAVEKERELYAPHAKVFRVYDEAATSFERDVAIEFGVGMIKTEKARGTKEEDIGMIRDTMLLDAHFLVSERCKAAIKEISNYQTDEKTGKPQETHDHLIDCLRYFYRQSFFTLNLGMQPEDLGKPQPKIPEKFHFEDLLPRYDNEIEDVHEDLEELWN